MEYSPRKMNELLDSNDFKFKKKFGQNFIVDKNKCNQCGHCTGNRDVDYPQ